MSEQPNRNASHAVTPNPRGASVGVGTELQFGRFERSARLSRPRLQTFDYRGPHAYHVVTVVRNRVPVFTDIKIGQWCISILEDVAAGADFDLLAFCLMPDHLHLLARGRNDSSHLVTLLQRFKRRTAFHFKRQFGNQLWQDSYYDRVLRRDEDLQEVVDYILLNPVAEGLCSRPGDYPLSGGIHAVPTPDGPN